MSFINIFEINNYSKIKKKLQMLDLLSYKVIYEYSKTFNILHEGKLTDNKLVDSQEPDAKIRMRGNKKRIM